MNLKSDLYSDIFGFESERSIGTAFLTIIEQPIPIQKWLLVAHFEDGKNMISY